MKTLSTFLLMAVLLIACNAMADTFYFTQGNSGVVPAILPGQYYATLTLTLDTMTGDINATLAGTTWGTTQYRIGDGLGLNLNGPTSITADNFSAMNWSCCTTNVAYDGFGKFKESIDGPNGSSSALMSLSFVIHTTGGFSSVSELVELSGGQDFQSNFATHIYPFIQDPSGAYVANGNTGFAGDGPYTPPSVPEPASLMLVGSGLGLLASRLRRRK